MNSASGMPVGKVALILRSNDPAQALKYTTTSDLEGRVLFDHVAPGRYTLYAEKPGFLSQYYGIQRATGTGTPLTVSEGQLLKDLVFKLIPQGVISGKLTDDAGEPMNRVSIVAMQWGHSQGRRLLQPIRAEFTNDLGEYRIANLSPGKYYVAARRGETLAGQLDVARADVPLAQIPEKPEEGYQITYCPNSIDAAGAAVLEVMPGSELRSVDIQFRRARVFRVRGQVVDGATGQAAADANVSLMLSTTDNLLSMGSLGGPRLPGGKFEVAGVLPGTYELIAQVTKNGQIRYARQSIYVNNGNVMDIVITIPPAVDVAGRVRVSGEDLQTQSHEQQQHSEQHAFLMEAVRVLLYPAKGFGLGSLPQSTVQADGSFILRNVVPDKFRVQVSGTPPGSYLKSILMGGEQRVDGTVDLTVGTTIEIMLAMGAAKLTGSVVDTDDKPVSGAAVTLVPEEGEQGRIDLFRTATSDQDGQFELGDVVPGNYKIFAWQEVESRATQDPEFRRAFGAKATSLTLKEDGRETVRLKAISIEDVAQALGNRPP